MDYFATSSSTIPTLSQLVVATNRTKTKPTTGYWMAGNNFGFIESGSGKIVDARNQPIIISRSAERYADLVSMASAPQNIVAPMTGYFSAGGVIFKDRLQISNKDPNTAPIIATKDGKVINVLSVDSRSMGLEDLGVPMHGYYLIYGYIFYYYKGYILVNALNPNITVTNPVCLAEDGSVLSVTITTDGTKCLIPEEVAYIQFKYTSPVKVVPGGFEPAFDIPAKNLTNISAAPDIYTRSIGTFASAINIATGPFYNSDDTLITNTTKTVNGNTLFFNSNGMCSRYTGPLCQLIYGSGSQGFGLNDDKTLKVANVYPVPQATGTPFVVNGTKSLVVATDGTSKSATEIKVTDSKGVSITTLADGDISTMTMAALPDGKYNSGTIKIKGMVVQPDRGNSAVIWGLVAALLVFIFIILTLVLVKRHKKAKAAKVGMDNGQQSTEFAPVV
jgi:hypothetical protein